MTDVGHGHIALVVDLEGDVCYLEEAIWRCLFVEDIGAWSQVQFFWCCARSPFLYWSACDSVACVDFNFCAIHFVATKIGFGNGNLAWQIVCLISNGNLRTIGDNFVVLTLGILLTDVGDSNCTISLHFKSDICNLKEAIWRRLFMEDISTWI